MKGRRKGGRNRRERERERENKKERKKERKKEKEREREKERKRERRGRCDAVASLRMACDRRRLDKGAVGGAVVGGSKWESRTRGGFSGPS